jgi:type VI secretion system lysozyme-like protein
LLLNTRAEGCLLDTSFGLPDLTEFVHAGPAGTVALQHLLAARVARHEPRLAQITVHARETDAASPGLRFTLRATRADGSRLSLTACVEHGGQVTVTLDPTRA